MWIRPSYVLPPSLSFCWARISSWQTATQDKPFPSQILKFTILSLNVTCSLSKHKFLSAIAPCTRFTFRTITSHEILAVFPFLLCRPNEEISPPLMPLLLLFHIDFNNSMASHYNHNPTSQQSNLMPVLIERNCWLLTQWTQRCFSQ